MFDKKIWEFTTLIAAHAPHLWNANAAPSDHALYHFWKHHRQMVHQCLLQYSALEQTKSGRTSVEQVKLINEIQHMEMLIRVFCAALMRVDYHLKKTLTEPVVRSVFTGQLRLRNESLKCLLELSNNDHLSAKSVNELRKYLEHHTDLLLGHLLTPSHNAEFTHELERARSYRDVDFAEILLVNESYSPWDAINQAGEFLSWMDAVNHESKITNWEQLKGSMLKCYPPTAFHEHGTFKPVHKSIQATLNPVH